MSGWAVFPYQHISPLWSEVQLSNPMHWVARLGIWPKARHIGSSLPCQSTSQSWHCFHLFHHCTLTGNLSPGPARDVQVPQLWSRAPPPLWPLRHPPSSWVPCTAPSTALPGASCTISVAGTPFGIAAIKILLSKQQSKDQPILKSVLLQTFRLILKITKVNGVQSQMNHPSKSKILCTR